LCSKALGSVVRLIEVEISALDALVFPIPLLIIIVTIVTMVAILITLVVVPAILVAGPAADIGFHERVEVRVFEHSAFSLGVGDDVRILQSIIGIVKRIS
jgi:hypothetical protein